MNGAGGLTSWTGVVNMQVPDRRNPDPRKLDGFAGFVVLIGVLTWDSN